MKKLTVVQAVALAKEADRLFNRAANSWVRGSNSGNDHANKLAQANCDKLRAKAEALLKPLAIVVDYPGLYPSFTVKGYCEHSTLCAISAALDNRQKARAV